MGLCRKKTRKICLLGDDEVGLILNRLSDSKDRISFSEVCKQWLRVEGLTRSSIHLLQPGCLRHLLPRFPNLVTFQTSKSITITDADLNFLSQTCPRIEVIILDLKSSQIWEGRYFLGDGLCALAKGCPKLSQVSLRHRKMLGGLVSLLNSAYNLTCLNLGHCGGSVTDKALEAIGSLSSISYLNLKRCFRITDRGLGFLANGSSSKTLTELVLANCWEISDVGVSLLVNMCCLEKLSLASSGKQVTNVGGLAISRIQTLKKLNLSGLEKVSNRTIIALGENCLNLEVLDVTGCELVTGAGIRALWSHKSLQCLALGFCSNMNPGDVEHVMLECPALNSIKWILSRSGSSRFKFKRPLLGASWSVRLEYTDELLASWEQQLVYFNHVLN